MTGNGIAQFQSEWKAYQKNINTSDPSSYYNRIFGFVAHGPVYDSIGKVAGKAATMAVSKMDSSGGFWVKPQYNEFNEVANGYGFISSGDKDLNWLAGKLRIGGNWPTYQAGPNTMEFPLEVDNAIMIKNGELRLRSNPSNFPGITWQNIAGTFLGGFYINSAGSSYWENRDSTKGINMQIGDASGAKFPMALRHRKVTMTVDSMQLVYNTETFPQHTTSDLTGYYIQVRRASDGTYKDYTGSLGAGGASALSAITAATAANSIDNTDYNQVWQWTGLSGRALRLESASTLAAGNNQQLFSVSLTGAHANSSQTTTAGHFSNTHTGTGSTNNALVAIATGGANNYALDATGNVRSSTSFDAAQSGTEGYRFGGTLRIWDNGSQMRITPSGPTVNVAGAIASYNVGLSNSITTDGQSGYIYRNSGGLQLQTSGNVGIGSGVGTSATARLHLSAGTSSANTAPEKYSPGTLLAVIEAFAKESNANGMYQSNNALNRYAEGGYIKDFYTEVNNVSTTETDLYSYTTKANTFAADGEKLFAEFTGTTTGHATATRTWQVYFGGVSISTSGSFFTGIDATGLEWKIRVTGIRRSSTSIVWTIDYIVGASGVTSVTDVAVQTGLTLSGTNVFKLTGQAGGTGAGSDQIKAQYGMIAWYGASNN
jgi:hypothetical protein